MTALALRSYHEIRRGVGRISGAWLAVLLIPAAVLALDPGNLPTVVTTAVSALSGTLPYVAVAVVLIGFLKATGAETVVARAFEGREGRMILFAALLGGLAPFCSCEVVPFIAALLVAGAPLSAVMAFWLSAPLIDPPTLLITASVLGWPFAIGKAVSAVGIGILGGFAMAGLMRGGAFADPLRPRIAAADDACCHDHGHGSLAGTPHWAFWREPARRAVFRAQALENALFLIKWLSLAYLLEALLLSYVPAELVAGLAGGDGFGATVVGALVGAPAYLNSYAAPPLIAGLMAQGMSTSAAMAFMTAGAVSCIPAMAAVYSLVKSPVFAAYVFFGFAGAVLAGTVYGALV